MPQEFDLQQALKFAIHTEKNVMDFYMRAASITKNERGKKVFEQLAGEEQTHVGHLFPLYRGGDLGTFDQFILTPPHADTVMLVRLEKALNELTHERKAMEIALAEEEALAKGLRQTASHVVDPMARAVFERLARETEDHCALIESEYAHLMAMVHETDMNIYVRE